MGMLAQTFIEAIIQIIIFTSVPFLWWLISSRKKIGFFEWMGLKRFDNSNSNKTLLWVVSVASFFLLLSILMLYLVRNVQTATSEFSGKGIVAIPSVLIYAVLKTSLSEELLFRGFLLKRISNHFNFTIGNLIQSILFGLMHGVMFFKINFIIAIICILFTGIIAWCMGFINEKKSNGSILPSWCIHAIANIFSGICSAITLF